MKCSWLAAVMALTEWEVPEGDSTLLTSRRTGLRLLDRWGTADSTTQLLSGRNPQRREEIQSISLPVLSSNLRITAHTRPGPAPKARDGGPGARGAGPGPWQGVQTASPLRDARTHHSELWHHASSADLPAATVTGDRGLSSLQTSRSLTGE